MLLDAADVAAAVPQQIVHDLKAERMGQSFQQSRLRLIVCQVFHIFTIPSFLY